MWPTEYTFSVVESTIFFLYLISIFGLVFVILLENRNPLKTITWVTVLLMLPGIGLLFYFFFGQDNRRRRLISRRTYKRIILPLHSITLSQESCSVAPQFKPLIQLINRGKQAPLLSAYRITTYTDGRSMFDSLIEQITAAKHHIHLQYYIFNDDEIGREIQQLLIAKAKEGVKIRVIYDDVGNWSVKRSFFQEMKSGGVEIYPFLRVAFPLLTNKVNYRNHRKVVVIDGVIGYIGGMNIADRYLKGNRLGPWRDTHFCLQGKVVHALQSAFIMDWYVVSKQLLRDEAYHPIVNSDATIATQIATSGPIGQWRTLSQALMFCVTNAKRYLYIQTPYFLPTEALNQALQAAALGGVDIRLMLPECSDTRISDLASHSYIEDMLKSGVKVFFYNKGFLHSKLLVMDDSLACIGSANFDFRSLEHNFEINAFVYDPSFAAEMRTIFISDQTHASTQINPKSWLDRSLFTRLIESFLRLFAPLL